VRLAPSNSKTVPLKTEAFVDAANPCGTTITG
jgi:hypothetical protein